jgi:hypothetical protein
MMYVIDSVCALTPISQKYQKQSSFDKVKFARSKANESKTAHVSTVGRPRDVGI